MQRGEILKIRSIAVIIVTALIMSGCTFFTDFRLNFVNETGGESLDLLYSEEGSAEFTLILENVETSALYVFPEGGVFSFKVVGSDSGLIYGTADDMDMRMKLGGGEYDFQIRVTDIGYVYFE